MSIYVGRYGKIRIRREFPAPVILPASALGGGYITVDSDGWVPTDAVVLVHDSGGSATSLTGFLYRNELGRVYLHSTAAGALNNDDATRLSLTGIDTAPMILASAGSGGQTSTLVSFLDGLSSPPSTETSLQAYPSTFNAWKAGGTNYTAWETQGLIEKYRFNTSGNIVDTTGLGDKFGDSIKTLITGEGTMDFYINLFEDTSQQDSDPLLRLALMLDQGARANVRFYLREPQTLEPYGTRTPYTGVLYYETTILLSDTVLDCSAGDVVTASSDFVSIGRINLRNNPT